ncbi:hypothetical protein BTS2_1328 [Bacillus sp. TS-2]|nr:hypothetical protein BTS2_1328 [Bacillus sp. TS-2]
MITIESKNLTERENYKLLIGSVIPRPIAFVTSLSKQGVLNGAPFSYFTIISSAPPRILLSIARREGEMKDTTVNILYKKEFVVHTVDEANVNEINLSAKSLPHNESEIEEIGMSTIKSHLVDVPAVTQSKIRFECLLDQHIPLEDEQGFMNADLIIGRVICYHIEDQLYDDGKIIQDKWEAVSRLAGHDYARIGEVFTLTRPK